MLGRTLAAFGVAAALFTTSAHAAIIQDRGPLLSATNGIALGPDGNFWVAEEFNGTVARMTPDGAVLGRYAVGSGPTSVANGPDGRVWVSVTGANKLTWFDATASTPTAHDVPTGAGAGCGPVAIVAGQDGRMYFSKPDCGTPEVGTVAGDGTGVVTTRTNRGKAYDLEATNGKLYAPDVNDDAVRRIALGTNLTVETAIGAPAGSGPDGIAADGAGNLWVTLYNTGRVGRFPAAQDLGTVTELTPTGGTLDEAFGIVAGKDGRVYVTGKVSANVARIDAGGNFRFYPTTGQPWQIVNGPDGDLYFTDRSSTRVQRFLSAAPKPATIAATGVSDSVGSVSATVDPRGNETQIVVEYGPTTAYGATSAPVTLPAGAGAGPAAAQVALGGLAPATTYHVRVRATNEEGTTTGDDTTFATAPKTITTCLVAAIRLAAAKRCTVALPKLAARTSFSWAFIGSRTALRKVDISGLTGGETAKVTCSGKGCPFKSKTYSKLKKGKKALGSRFGLKRKLSKGAKLEVRVTKPGTIGSSALLTVRGRKQDPKIVRSCLHPGAKKPSRC